MNIIHDPVRSPHAPETARFGLLGAIVAGADAIRLPVRLTSDGYAVVLEDETIDRLTGKSGRVAEMKLKDLRALDFGATFKSADGKPFAYRARVETVPMLFDYLPDDIWYVIDVKEPKKKLVNEVLRAATNRGIQDRIILIGGAAGSQPADAVLVPLDEFLADPSLGAPARLGAIVTGRVTAGDYAKLRRTATCWGILTTSVLETVAITHPGWVWVDEQWNQSAAKHEDVNANTWHLGYAKYNPQHFCHVYPDKGLHISIKPYDGPVDIPKSGDPVKDELQKLTEDSWAALRTWPFYSGGGAGFAPGIRGDFSAEVDIESIAAEQATTVEMAALNVDPGAHRTPWREQNGKWVPNYPTSFREKQTFFDPHGAPPYVGVEHDEDDGWRINWNLGTDYDANQYGKAFGDGKELTGRMRLDRRGDHWAAFYRPKGLSSVADWICVGAVRNESLNSVVYLRLAGKRWRQENPANPSEFVPVIPNHFTFRNFKLTRYV